MSQEFTIAAAARDHTGTRASKRLRADGQVPAILYGHKVAPANLAVDVRQLRTLLRDHAHGLLNLDIAGKPESAVIKDLQYDAFGIEILHVDFHRVGKGERIVVEVAIDLKGTAPGVNQGGVLDFELHELRVECPAENIVERISVSIDKLKLNEAIHVKDVVLPAGMVCKNDPEQIVVKVHPKPTDGETAAAAGPTAEPEVIRREKAAEDEAEGKDKK